MIRIKELREKKGINMRQTAKELGIPYTTYISYEKGDREPNSEMLIELAEFFHCSIDYLLGRSEDVIDTEKWDEEAEAFSRCMQQQWQSDQKAVESLFPSFSEDAKALILDQLFPMMRALNTKGIHKLTERADELVRLREYVDKELNEVMDETPE